MRLALGDFGVDWVSLVAGLIKEGVDIAVSYDQLSKQEAAAKAEQAAMERAAAEQRAAAEAQAAAAKATAQTGLETEALGLNLNPNTVLLVVGGLVAVLLIARR